MIKHPSKGTVLRNTGWILFDKILRLLGTLLIGILIARNLGPIEFGIFSFATAFVAIFAAIAGFGIQQIAIRNLILNPENAGITIKTVFRLLSYLGVLATTLSIIAAYTLLNDESSEQLFAIYILSIPLLTKGSEAIKFWLEAKIASHKAISIEVSIYLVFLAIKFATLTAYPNLKLFVVITAVETTIAGIALILLYKNNSHGYQEFGYSATVAKKLLKEALPLAISAFSIMIYMKIDQIMIGEMLSKEDVGFYVAATRICESWYFIPLAFVASAYPRALASYSSNRKEYNQQLGYIAVLVIFIGYTAALVGSLLSTPGITLIYGNQYSQSIRVFDIYIWGGVLVCTSTLTGKWLTTEGLSHAAATRSVIGLITNVILNFILIPLYGINGAAIATLISFLIANLLSLALTKKTRPLFWMMIKALLLADLFKAISSFKRHTETSAS